MSSRRFLAIIGILLASCARTTPVAVVSLSDLPLAEQALPEGTHRRRVAFLSLAGEPIAVHVPDSAQVGEPVQAQITTYSGGCVSDDTTVTTVSGLRADVVPYQLVYRPRAKGACTAELRINRRQVRLTFATAGRARVRVIGRVVGDEPVIVPGDSLVAVDRFVTVR